MPSLPAVSIGAGTEVTALDADDTRTLIIFSNPDSSAIIYVSDEPGHRTDGIPVYPQNTIALSVSEGWNCAAKHYAYCAAAKSLNVSTGSMWKGPPQSGTPAPGEQPAPHDPPM